MTPLAVQYAASYAGLSFWELHRVQLVHIADYQRFKAEGDTSRADSALRAVNAIGEVLDERDGTSRCA